MGVKLAKDLLAIAQVGLDAAQGLSWGQVAKVTTQLLLTGEGEHWRGEGAKVNRLKGKKGRGFQLLLQQERNLQVKGVGVASVALC